MIDETNMTTAPTDAETKTGMSEQASDMPPAEQAATGKALQPSEVHQAAVQQVSGGEVRLVQSAAGSIRGDDVSLVQSAAGFVRGDDVTLSMGGAALIAGERVRVAQGGAQAIIATDSVSIEQGGAGLVVAGNVELHPQTLAGVVIAGNVTGDVRALFDWRAALAFGVAFALFRALLGGLRRR